MLQLKQTRCNNHQSHFNNENWKDLLKDCYILLIIFAICITSSAMAILEPFLPIWLIQIINPEKWQLGTVFIPDSLGYLIGTNFFGSLSYTLGQWRVAVLATLLVGLSAIMIPAATTIVGLVSPHFGLGLGIGIVDSALVPMLANLVDTRHPNLHYGSVYALQQTAVSLAYSIGPIIGGRFVKTIGFPWLMRTVGIINVLYCGMLVFLSKVSNNQMEKINSGTITDYKSTSGVVSFFNKPIAYEKLDDTTAAN